MEYETKVYLVLLPQKCDEGPHIFNKNIMSTENLLQERNTTHGSFIVNGRVSQQLKEVFRSEPGWEQLDIIHREAIDHICGKFGRIMAGQPTFDDHWDDIAGYAQLPKKFNHGKIQEES